MIDNKLLFGISALLAFFIVYTLLKSSSKGSGSGYEVELQKVVDSDEFKVKGRYE